MGVMHNNITAVTANWLSAENTKRSILSFQRFYPQIPVVVVDDDSKKEDRPLFYQSYNGTWNNPDFMFDPDTEKLEELPNVTLLRVPAYEHVEAKGHGKAIDLAIENLKTDWMFHFHSDYRLTSLGILEELTEGLDDSYCASGDSKTRVDQMKAVSSIAAVYNVKAGKEHNVTFQPVVYHPDNTVSPFPGIAGEYDTAIEAGAYYTGKLHQLGYKIKWVTNPHGRYGVHLRWKGDLNAWNKEF